MARLNITLPAMGEGVIEATINKWLVSEGAQVKEDDPLVEVATDKVDSEVPAPMAGTIVSIAVKEGSVAKIGEVLAVIESDVTPTEEDLKKVDKEVERVRETISEEKKEKPEAEELCTGNEKPYSLGKIYFTRWSEILQHMKESATDELDRIHRVPGWMAG